MSEASIDAIIGVMVLAETDVTEALASIQQARDSLNDALAKYDSVNGTGTKSSTLLSVRSKIQSMLDELERVDQTGQAATAEGVQWVNKVTS